MAKKRTPPEKSAPKATGLTFENLVLSIRGVDQELAAQASRAVNVSKMTRWQRQAQPQRLVRRYIGTLRLIGFAGGSSPAKARRRTSSI